MKKLYAFLFALFFLYGCSAKQEQLSALSEAKKESSPAVQSHKKAAKPGAPVVLGSPSTINILANQASHIDVTLTTESNIGEMQVDIIPGEGIQLIDDNSVQTFSVNGAADYHVPMKLFASSNGRFYVNLHITLTFDGVISQRNLAFIIQVGPVEKPQTNPNKVLEKSSSEKLILMPAQEVILPKEL